MFNKKTAAVITALLLVYFFWGTEYFIIKIAVRELPPVLLSAIYAFIGGILLFIIVTLKGSKRPTAMDIKNTFLSGFFFVFISGGLIPVSSVYLDSGLVALLSGLSPVVTISAESLILKIKSLNKYVAAALVLGFIGLICAIVPSLGDNAQISLPGVILATVSAVFWSVGMLITKHATYTIPVLTRNSLQLLFGGILLFIASVALGEVRNFNITTISHTSIFCIFYLVIASSIIAYTAYLWVLKNATIAIASSTAYICPVVALVIGRTFGGESLTAYTALSVVFIITSLFMLAGGLRNQT